MELFVAFDILAYAMNLLERVPEIIAGSCEPQEPRCRLSWEPLRGLF